MTQKSKITPVPTLILFEALSINQPSKDSASKDSASKGLLSAQV